MIFVVDNNKIGSMVGGMQNTETRKTTTTVNSLANVNEGDELVWVDGLGNRCSTKVVKDHRGTLRMPMSFQSPSVQHMLNLHGSLGKL